MAAVYAISDNTACKSRLYVTSREPTEYRMSARARIRFSRFSASCGFVFVEVRAFARNKAQ